MAEELTSGAGASPSPTGQTATSGAQPQSASDTQTPSKVNLQDIPEFREYQRQVSQTITQLQREQAKIAEEREAAKLAGMDDYDRQQYQAEKYRKEAEELKTKLEMRELAAARQRDIDELHQKYGIPKKHLERASSYQAAEEMAKEFAADIESGVKRKVQEREEKLSRNEPDMGGGRHISGKAAALQQAIQKKDSNSFYRTLLSDDD